jgi:hypothetical protein
LYKKTALTVKQMTLNETEKQNSANNVFSVKDAQEHLSGNAHTINCSKNVIGLNFGLRKALVYVNFAHCLGIALSSLKTLKTTGLAGFLKSKILITRDASILFMTAHISIRTGALSV